MAAYVIAEIEILDPVRYEEYKKGAARSLEAHGGRFLARGGQVAPLEGGWDPKRLVILEFESLEKARQWWASPEYEAPKALRQEVARTRMVALDGGPS